MIKNWLQGIFTFTVILLCYQTHAQSIDFQLSNRFVGNSIEIGYQHHFKNNLSLLGGFSFHKHSQTSFRLNQSRYYHGLTTEYVHESIGFYAGLDYRIPLKHPNWSTHIQFRTNLNYAGYSVYQLNTGYTPSLWIENQANFGVSYTFDSGVRVKAALGISNTMIRTGARGTMIKEDLSVEYANRPVYQSEGFTPTGMITISIPLSIFKRKQKKFDENKIRRAY